MSRFNAVTAFAIAGLAVAAQGQVLISEFSPNPTGADPATTTIELRGTPGASFSGFLINVDTDGPVTGGAFNFVNPTGSFAVSGTFDANGLLTITVSDFENPSFGLFLATSSLAAGTNLDTNDDGLIDDLSVFGTILDVIFTSDSVDDVALSAALISQIGLGVNLAFSGLSGNSSEALFVFRDSITGEAFQAVTNLTTAPSLADILIFDANGNQVDIAQFNIDPRLETFGAVNPTLVPAPGAIALMGLGGLAASRRRRA